LQVTAMEREGDPMKKSAKVLWITAASMLAAPGVRAGDATVRAAISFDFQVADRQLPSGEYRFVTRADPGVVLVYSSKTPELLATVLCRPLQDNAEESGRVAFDRHGSQHFLKWIRAADGSGVYLPQTRSESQAEARVLAEARARAAQAQAQAGAAAKTAMP
jgi:hypothetical protein